MIASSSDKHFLHSSVVLRHANGDSGEAEHHIETILTEAAVAKRRVWVSSVLFAELRPSTFVPGRFATLFESDPLHPGAGDAGDARPERDAAGGEAPRRQMA